MVTRITRMQKKEKKKKRKKSTRFPSISRPRSQSGTVHTGSDTHWFDIEIQSLRNFSFGKRWRGRGWSRSPPIFPDFSGARPRVFFSFLPVLFKTRKKSKGDDLPSSRDSWNLERNRTEEKRRGGKAKNRETGPGSSDIQLDLRLHKLRIRVCSWIPYIRH